MEQIACAYVYFYKCAHIYENHLVPILKLTSGEKQTLFKNCHEWGFCIPIPWAGESLASCVATFPLSWLRCLGFDRATQKQQPFATGTCCAQRALDCTGAKENRINYKCFVCLWLQDKPVVIGTPLIDNSWMWAVFV